MRRDPDNPTNLLDHVLDDVEADQWLLVHRDLRDLPRVRAVMDALVQLFQEERGTLEGRRAAGRTERSGTRSLLSTA